MHRWTARLRTKSGRHKGLRTCSKCGLSLLPTPGSPRYCVITAARIFDADSVPPCNANRKEAR